MKNVFFNEREITFLDIVPPKGMCEAQSRAKRGISLPYESPWVPIISMRGKFPIGSYNLNGFLQASVLHLSKAFGLVPSLRSGLIMRIVYNLTVQAWLGCHQPNRVRGT